MLDKTKLLESNPQFVFLNGYYQDPRNQYRESSIWHGLELAISEVYDACTDLSLFSIELENQLHTDELKHALSPGPFNYLLSANFQGINTILDLTQDYGGTIEFLSSFAVEIDAVRIDPGKARLTAKRIDDKSNICVSCSNLENMNWPKRHYDLIFLGDLENLCLNQDQRIVLFKNLNQALSKSGKLLIAAPNSERLDRWFDPFACVTHGQSNVYQGLYESDNGTNSLEGLKSALDIAQLTEITTFASFSARNQISNLFSLDYLDSQYALNHFYRTDFIQNSAVSSYALLRRLKQENTPLHPHATRYLITAGKSQSGIQQMFDLDFAHYPGTGRQPAWRAVTSKTIASDIVSKTPLSTRNRQADVNAIIEQNLETQHYQPGNLLIDDWVNAAIKSNNAELTRQIQRYADWLEHQNSVLGSENFHKISYDLLPFNIIVDENGELNAIDPEWQLNENFTIEFILFRAIFWFGFENRSLIKDMCSAINTHTLGMFVCHFMPNIDSSDELKQFVALEERVQANIDNNFSAGAVANALMQTVDETKLPANTAPRVCQIQWGDQQGRMDTSNAQFRNWQGDTAQIEFTLPHFKKETPILRVDPIAGQGAFSVQSMELRDAKGKQSFVLSNANEVLVACSLVNAEMSEDGQSCFATNTDPYLLFDLTEHISTENEYVCRITLATPSEAHIEGLLTQLSARVEQQGSIVQKQTNRLNEYRSKIDFLNVQLKGAKQSRDDLIRARDDLARANYSLNKSHLALLAEARHNTHTRMTLLMDQLRDQLRHNHAVDMYLLERPSTRLARLISRIWSTVTGKTHTEDTTVGDEPKPIEPEVLVTKTEDKATPKSEVDRIDKEEELIGQNLEDYQLWIQQNSLNEQDIADAKKNIDNFKIKPVFSILVPIYNTDPEYLLPMVRSVCDQIYPRWQLILVDDCSPKKWLRTILEQELPKDPRIQIQLNDKNQGIALTSNDALALASGDYIALLDHDDEIPIEALYENAKVINQQPDVGLIYSDEDKMDTQGNRLEPFFKPDYSPDLLDTNNYICHFTVIKKSIADQIGGFRKGFDGSQDHDIILRAIAASPSVVHIPKILYHWRKIPGSTAVEYNAKSYAWEAGRKAVEDARARVDDNTSVELGVMNGTYRVYRKIRGNPLVSIVIPFKDKPELLDACLNSILNATDYQNYEVIGVSNDSVENATFKTMDDFCQRDDRIRFIEKNTEFNFSAICNYGVKHANGEYILLLNNDVTVEDGQWLERLLEHAQRPEVGAVGGKLVFPNGQIQHAGIVAGMVGAAGHPHKFFPDGHIGYHGRLYMVSNVSAVTGAMMMLSKANFLEVGGLDEDHLAVAYNDVDLCLKLLDAGYLNIFTPHCRAIHHESLSRGYEDTEEKLARLKSEQAHFLEKWQDFLAKGDPYYNPNLSLLNERFSLKFADE